MRERRDGLGWGKGRHQFCHPRPILTHHISRRGPSRSLWINNMDVPQDHLLSIFRDIISPRPSFYCQCVHKSSSRTCRIFIFIFFFGGGEEKAQRICRGYMIYYSVFAQVDRKEHILKRPIIYAATRYTLNARVSGQKKCFCFMPNTSSLSGKIK